MESCNHQWIANSGSNDKPCGYCWKYPGLKLRYRCNICILESCRFCLIEKWQLPLEGCIPLDTRSNRYQPLQFQILALEKLIDELIKWTGKLEDIVDKIGAVVESFE